MFDKNKDPEPLFDLDLILKQGQLIPTYSTQPEDIVKRIMDVFDEGIECLQQIPQLEPILLRHLFKTHGKKMLKAPLRPRQKPSPVDPNKKSVLPDENTWLWDAYDDLRTALTAAIQPLYEYVQTFSQFEEQHQLQPEKYVADLDGGVADQEPMDAEALRAEIFSLREKEAELKGRIPESATVSIFKINIKDIRTSYALKYGTIIEKLIKLISKRAIDANYRITTEFGAITERIQTPPKNIQELTDTKKYLSEIGITIEKLKTEIDQCMRTYDICGEFQHEFTGGENDDKWKLFGAPQRIMEAIESQTATLEKQKEAFIKAMELEQEEFEETLDSLALTVEGFSTYDDLTKYMDIAENVESVNERLKQCVEQSRQFGQSEFLVGKEQKDYSRLAVMQKDFLPFSNLWLTTRTWHLRHEAWT